LVVILSILSVPFTAFIERGKSNNLILRVKKIIEIPQGVEVKIDGDLVFVKGPKGELKRNTRPEIKVRLKIVRF